MPKNKIQHRVPWKLGLFAANQAPRCHARRKYDGSRCQAPAVTNKRVCRIHGGASPGAPKGNQNALTTGLHTAKAKADRRAAKATIRQMNELVGLINSTI